MKSCVLLSIVILSTAPLMGCAFPAETGSEDIGVAQEAENGENGLDWNGLSSNGLSSNGLSSNGLSSNGLSSNGLSSNGLVMSALTDSLAQMLLKYIASCALTPDQHIDLVVNGTPLTFPGSLGLAPGWGVDGGSCDASCQAWVSGCVLSRVNYLGQHIPVSLWGANPALATSLSERTDYPNREGAYYGTIFPATQVRFACTSPGSTLITRVCGPSTSNCIMKYLGDCPSVCDNVDPVDGSYSNCHDDHGNLVPGAVTIYRLQD